MVFGPAEYHKKIYIPTGHICRGNLSFLVWQMDHWQSCSQRQCAVAGLAEYHKKISITGGHFFRGNVGGVS